MFQSTEHGPVEFTPEEFAEHNAKVQMLAAKADSEREAAYKIKRSAEYPSIGDQLDALFKAGAFPADMAATIQAVKDKYPKG